MHHADNERRYYRVERLPDPELDALRQRQARIEPAAARVAAWCCTSSLIAVAIAVGLIGHACLPALLAWVRS